MTRLPTRVKAVAAPALAEERPPLRPDLSVSLGVIKDCWAKCVPPALRNADLKGDYNNKHFLSCVLAKASWLSQEKVTGRGNAQCPSRPGRSDT